MGRYLPIVFMACPASKQSASAAIFILVSFKSFHVSSGSHFSFGQILLVIPLPYLAFCRHLGSWYWLPAPVKPVSPSCVWAVAAFSNVGGDSGKGK